MSQDLGTSPVPSGLTEDTVKSSTVNSTDTRTSHPWGKPRDTVQADALSSVARQNKPGDGSTAPAESERDINQQGAVKTEKDTKIDIETYTKLQKDYQTLAQQHEETLNALRYSKASNQHMERFHREELQQARQYAGEEVIKQIFGVPDSLEAALQQLDEISPVNQKLDETVLEQIKKGMQNALDAIVAIFKKLGVTEINPVVEEAFDPNIHSAIATELSKEPSQAVNTIIRVLRKGYCLHKRVMRPAMVVISRAKE